MQKQLMKQAYKPREITYLEVISSSGVCSRTLEDKMNI